MLAGHLRATGGPACTRLCRGEADARRWPIVVLVRLAAHGWHGRPALAASDPLASCVSGSTVTCVDGGGCLPQA